MARPNIIYMWSGDSRARVPDFPALVERGIFAVIHRASEGTQFVDTLYTDRREAALAAGLLWGAAHTLDSGDNQGTAFLNAIGYTDQNVDLTTTLCAVTYEDTFDPPALHQLYTFAGYVDRNAPVSTVIRAGDYFRRTMGAEDQQAFVAPQMRGATSFFRQHRLWSMENPGLNQPVGPTPFPFESVFIYPMSPMMIDPVIGKDGLMIFNGDRQTLAARWAS